MITGNGLLGVVTNGKFDYDMALENHAEIFSKEFNAVSFKLGDTDSILSNEDLVEEQYPKNERVSDLMERAYYSGRYAYLCSAGFSTPRLYGMWTDEFTLK